MSGVFKVIVINSVNLIFKAGLYYVHKTTSIYPARDFAFGCCRELSVADHGSVRAQNFRMAIDFGQTQLAQYGGYGLLKPQYCFQFKSQSMAQDHASPNDHRRWSQ